MIELGESHTEEQVSQGSGNPALALSLRCLPVARVGRDAEQKFWVEKASDWAMARTKLSLSEI